MSEEKSTPQAVELDLKAKGVKAIANALSELDYDGYQSIADLTVYCAVAGYLAGVTKESHAAMLLEAYEMAEEATDG